MRIHGNARTCPNSRRLLVRRIEEEGWSRTAWAGSLDALTYLVAHGVSIEHPGVRSSPQDSEE